MKDASGHNYKLLHFICTGVISEQVTMSAGGNNPVPATMPPLVPVTNVSTPASNPTPPRKTLQETIKDIEASITVSSRKGMCLQPEQKLLFFILCFYFVLFYLLIHLIHQFIHSFIHSLIYLYTKEKKKLIKVQEITKLNSLHGNVPNLDIMLL